MNILVHICADGNTIRPYSGFLCNHCYEKSVSFFVNMSDYEYLHQQIQEVSEWEMVSVYKKDIDKRGVGMRGF